MYNLDKYKGKELIVRKRVAGFLEKMFKAFEFDFHHDRFKKVVYSEDAYNCELEEKFKAYYDGYWFLISNAKNALSNELVNKFMFLIFGRTVDYSLILRITTGYFAFIDAPQFERAVDFHMKAYEEMSEFPEFDRTTISLMLFNYSLIKNGVPAINILPLKFQEYVHCREEYLNGAKDKMYEFFIQILHNERLQDKSYYKNLREVRTDEIREVILRDKDFIMDKLKIKSISIFGSFANGIDRVDSDIDFLVSFSLDLIKAEKQANIEFFKNYYFKKFDRFIDITEVGEYFNDDLIKKIPYAKKIF